MCICIHVSSMKYFILPIEILELCAQNLHICTDVDQLEAVKEHVGKERLQLEKRLAVSEVRICCVNLLFHVYEDDDVLCS